MFTNKKGMSFLITLLVFAFVALAFGFIYLFFLQGSLSKQEGIVDTQISGIQGDADKDSIRNFFDKCPCTFGDSIDEGCPATFSLEQRQEDVKKYNKGSIPIDYDLYTEIGTQFLKSNQKPQSIADVIKKVYLKYVF